MASDLRERVLERLDVRKKFQEFGVEITSTSPTAEGWLTCRRFGSAPGEDRNPSASINVKSGVYHEFTSAGENTKSIFDIGAECGKYATWKDCLDALAEEVGIEVRKKQSFPPEWFKRTAAPILPEEASRFVLAKPGVTLEAILSSGAVSISRWGQQLIAFPGYFPNESRNLLNPVAWQACDLDGLGIPDKDGTLRRFLNIPGSRDSMIGPDCLASEVVHKMEGTSDWLVSRALGMPSFTVTNGATARRFLMSVANVFRGKTVYIWPDADEPGMAGAVQVASALKKHAAKVYIVKLPFPIQKNHGKDFRDFVKAGHGKDDVLKLMQVAEEYGSSTVHQQQNFDIGKHAKMGKILLKDRLVFNEIPTLVYWSGDYWIWHPEKRRYSLVERERLEGMISNFIQQSVDALDLYNNLTASDVKNVISNIRGRCLSPDDEYEIPHWLDDPERSRHFVTMRNGIFNLDDATNGNGHVLIPHTPCWFSLVSLPYNYDPDSTCPTWEWFLQEQIGDRELIMVCQEFFGYCLLETLAAKKMLILEGDTDTGKTTFCNVMIAFLGKHNTASIPFSQFSNQFGLYPMIGKSANISSEASEFDKPREEIVKQWTSGDQITIDRKHRNPITIRPTAKLVMATNTLPRFVDRSHALWERMIIVPFRKRIDERHRDVTVAQRICAGELAGVFNWALEGAKRLLSNHCNFTSSNIVKSAVREAMLDANHTLSYLITHYREAEFSREPEMKVYIKYSDHSSTTHVYPLGLAAFRKEVKRAFQRSERITGQDGVVYYRGIEALLSTL
jgi:P4 family phage/plasmid primase-like protien